MHYFSIRNSEKILKIFNENSIENLNFYFIFIFILFFILFFENLLLKIEPSEITPVFYNSFFRFRGGDFPPFPPGYALGSFNPQGVEGASGNFIIVW